MTIRSEELVVMFKTWHRLLANKREIEEARRTYNVADIVFQRWMVDRDKDLQGGCHNFVRVLSALATFGGAPDFGNAWEIFSRNGKQSDFNGLIPSCGHAHGRRFVARNRHPVI